MPNRIGKGVVEVVFDKDQASKAAQDAIQPGLKRLSEDIAGLAVGKKLFDFGKAGFDELAEAQKVSAQTANILKNLGGAAGVSAVQVDDLAVAMMKQSGVDDEVAKAAENTLLRLGVQGDAFKRATQESNDLSVAMGTDMTSAAELLGKALAHPEQAARLLRPAIGGLTDAQLASIKAFQAQGDEAGAQGVILDAVNAKVHGAAEAFGDTLPGKLAIAHESLANMKGELVAGMAPALEYGATAVTFLTEQVAALPEPLQAVIGTAALVGGGIAAIARPVSDVIGLYTRWKQTSELVAVAQEGLAVAEGEASVASSALLGPAGLVVLGLGAAATAAAIFGKSQHDAVKPAEDLVRALIAEKDAASGAVDAIEAKNLADNRSARTAHDAGVSYSLMNAAVQHGTDDFGAYVRAIDAHHDSLRTEASSLEDVRRRLLDAGAGTTEFGKSLLNLVDHTNLSGEQLVTYVQTIEHLHNVYGVSAEQAAAEIQSTKDVGLGAQTSAGQVDDLSGSFIDGAQAMADYAAAMKAMNDERLSEIDGLAGVQAAQIANTDAQINARTKLEELTKAQKDHKLSSDEEQTAVDGAQRAILDAANAAGDLAVKTAELNGVTDTAPAKQQAMVASLIGVRDTLAPGSPLFDYLQDYINKLNAIPTSITTQVHISTDGKLLSSGGGKTFAAEGYEGWAPAGSFRQFVAGDGTEDEYVSIRPRSKIADPTSAHINSALSGFGGDQSGSAAAAPIVVPVTLEIDGKKFAAATARHNSAALREYERSRR